MKDLLNKNVKKIKLPIKQIDLQGYKIEKGIGFKKQETETTRKAKINEERPPRFQLIIVGKQDEDVKVLEVNKINFVYLKNLLNRGKSIFMTQRQTGNYNSEIFLEPHEFDLWF
ncbi:MAG: hypothetical protein QCH99_04565 [Candidatus Bathyarchaeota archaeon]|nr:hypothetical protein [Candidatus Bathyarchaeum tardum]